jgi:hemerythrin
MAIEGTPMSNPVENLVIWSDEISLQLPEVDDQHRVLIDIINQIWRQLVHPAAEGTSVVPLLEELQTYTETHFTAEEQLMAGFGYPHLERHRVAHREFVGYIQHAREEYESGKPVAMELLRFLNDWLIHHIKVVDRDYATFIAGKQGGGLFRRFSSIFNSLGTALKAEGGAPHNELLFKGLDMRLAIRFHMEWRDRLTRHIDRQGETDPDINNVVRDDLCILGNWIKLRADEGWGAQPDFLTLQADHREFHFCAGQVLAEFDAGNPELARALLKTDFRRISDRVRYDIIQLYGAAH